MKLMATLKQESGKTSLLIPILLLITVSACGIAGYSYYRMKNPGSAAASPLANTMGVQPAQTPVFLKLEPFTVNLHGSPEEDDRVLYTGFTLRLPDDATRERLDQYLPEVRSRLLLLLTRQDQKALTTEEGKQALINEIKQVLAPPFTRNQPPQAITGVLFTSFILR